MKTGPKTGQLIKPEIEPDSAIVMAFFLNKSPSWRCLVFTVIKKKPFV